MNVNNLKNNIINSARKRLNHHKVQGASSSLSIHQVAELHDIISGRVDVNNVPQAQFFGMSSLN